VLGASAVITAAGGVLAGAEEVSVPNLVVKKTYLKTTSDSFELSPSWRNIFSATSITCPGTSGTCAARIEASAVFHFGGPGRGDPHCRVLRGGVILPVFALPGQVAMAPTADQGDVVVTFSWVFTGLPLGPHVIRLQCSKGEPDPVSAQRRTLTIDVYKPLVIRASIPRRHYIHHG
jgi:hypothetical protein